MRQTAPSHPLSGLRVVETGDQNVDFPGLLLAGLGAEVVKVEPPEGAPGRRIGPFAGDVADPERSLYFWAYNRGKRSVTVDTTSPAGQAELASLVREADVWLDSGTPALAPAFCGLDAAALRAESPALVTARLTPFGEDGPWAHYLGSDLVSLALGGVLMNCGYDAGLDGSYDLPPSWPHAFHAMHIAGEQLAMGIVGALVWRRTSGRGQALTCAMHDAIAKSTEVDLMSWVMLRMPHHRQTARHSGPDRSAPTIAPTKDGRWLNSMSLSPSDRTRLRAYLVAAGVVDEDALPAGQGDSARMVPGVGLKVSEENQRDIELVGRLTRRALFDDLPWLDAQAAGLLWSPVRKPHENVGDAHWQQRGTFATVRHDDLQQDVSYPVSKWVSSSSPWATGTPAPTLGPAPRTPLWTADREPLPAPTPAEATREWALSGVRVFDFSWFLASAGGTRFLAAMGADCIKVEWSAHPDTRLGAGAPVGGRAARESATAPLEQILDPDMGGNFNHKNAGKRGISLNVRHPEGLRMARELIRQSDIVAEGFSPGVMDRWGLGYEALCELRPDIIYAQQSGMGSAGVYGRTRTVGPIAAALAGTTEMSGRPDPASPAGWGYSYLDWLGAYSFASAILSALYERGRTGRGQYIDASQCEVGIFAAAVPILDWSVNGRDWSRPGNASPYQLAAPEGVFRTRGDDRWLAISCATDRQWLELATLAGAPEAAADERFATLPARIANRRSLNELVGRWTGQQDGYEAMALLQAHGIPAGVCQTAGDRCDLDPQLAHLAWLTEVTGTKIGRWPVGEVSVRMDRTPPYIGGRPDRGAPIYGEDNYEVYGELLGLSEAEVDKLAAEGVV